MGESLKRTVSSEDIDDSWIKVTFGPAPDE
jgi:hypothetical protein